MTIPAEYQQAHTTLGCRKGFYHGQVQVCGVHHDPWTPNGCPVAVKAAQEIGADALDRAAEGLGKEVREAGYLRGGYIDLWLRARAKRLRTGEDDE